MSYLLDTNILITLRKNKESVTVEKINDFYKASFISVITLGELKYGIETNNNILSKIKYDNFYNKLLIDFSGRILDINLPISEIWGMLKAENINNPKPDLDLYISATAIYYDLTIVSRNTKHLIGKVYNPWV